MFFSPSFSIVFFCDFVVWLRRCVVRRLVRRCLISRLIAMLIWFILEDQLRQRCRKYRYSRDLDFIILFVGILSLYAINFGAVSLFADSPFTFLVMLILMYSINLNEWILFSFCQKKNHFVHLHYSNGMSRHFHLKNIKLLHILYSICDLHLCRFRIES